ncbi:FxsA family protein [Ornithinimicrobium sp. Y1847]|uniref:FxsA family protein n=1 Tax=unclassified Ornithinimicrobium TaxID=2615080 RepID=UPI003B67B4FA
MTAGHPTSTRPTRRGRVLPWVVATLILLPVIEIAVLILVGQQIGLLWTVVLIIALAFLGVWLARRETSRTFRQLQRALQTGKMPTDEATDAILVMVGAFLLILPGFVSDAVGLLLVLPFTRPVARRAFQALVAARVLAVTRGTGAGGSGAGAPGRRSAPGRGQVIEGEIVSETPGPGSAGPKGPTPLP